MTTTTTTEPCFKCNASTAQEGADNGCPVCANTLDAPVMAEQPLFRMESASYIDGPWHHECDTTAAELDLANQCDAEVADEILPAIGALLIGAFYIYDGGAGGLTRYTRIA